MEKGWLAGLAGLAPDPDIFLVDGARLGMEEQEGLQRPGADPRRIGGIIMM